MQAILTAVKWKYPATEDCLKSGIQDKQRVSTNGATWAGLFGLPERSRRSEKRAVSCYTNENLKIVRKREMTLMDLSTFGGVGQFNQGSFAIDPASLYREFEKVK